MKKTSILLLLFSTCIFSTAQTIDALATEHIAVEENNVQSTVNNNNNNASASNPLWSEDFANGFPQGWVTYSDNTQGGAATCKWKWSTVGSWGYYQGTQGLSGATAMNSTTAANGFLISDTDSANHHTYGQPSGTTYQYIDSYFITDAIDLSNYPAVSLEFEHNFRYNNWGNAAFIPPSVWISNDSTTWTQFIVNNNVNNNAGSADPEYVSLNIGAIAGGQSTVYIKVGWTSRCYFWMLDDMKIIETPPNAIQMQNETFGGWLLGNPTTTGDLGMPYTFNPMKQVKSNPYRLEAQILNKGSNTQTNTKLNVSINGAGTTWSGSSAPASLAPNDTITVATQNTFTPTSLGPHIVDFWVSTDLIPFMSTSLTDTAGRTTIVTDTVYGRDYDWNGDGANLSTNGYELQNSMCGQVLVNAFEIYAVDTVTSISFFVGSNSQAGGNLKAVLYDYDNTATPNTNAPFLLASSDPYQLMNTDIGVWKTIKLTTPLAVTPGQTLLAGVQGFQGPQLVEICYSGDDGAVSYIQDNGCNLGGGGLGYWYSRRTIGIRMNLGNESTQPSSINESNFKGLFSLYPNPSKGIFTVDVKGLEEDEYILSVKDILGKEVVSANEKVNRNLKKTIDLSSYGSGTYFVTLTNSNTTITRKIVVE